jgi:predicted ATPase
VDPLTLFALANGAVSAVKAGCKLYKDIKGAAGEVHGVLKDLDEHFKKLHPPEKPATVEQRNQFVQEKNSIIDLNRKANADEHTGVYQEIGEHLGAYYDNFYKCMAIMEEEERRAETEVYTGDASLGKRALQRVLMRKQLEQMSKDLRELMVYQCPAELGGLYTEVEAMMRQMGANQRVLIAQQMQTQYAVKKKKQALFDRYMVEAVGTIATIIGIAVMTVGMAVVVEDRIKKYPHLGDGWVPKTEEQRRRDAEPKVYSGR